MSCKKSLIPSSNPSISERIHNGLNLCFLCCCERKQRQPRESTVIAVQVHGVFDRWNAHFRDNFLCRRRQGSLFAASQLLVIVFKGCIDLKANGRSRSSNAQHTSAGPCLK